MAPNIKQKVKELSRKNWFMYRITAFAVNLYDHMGGAKITKSGCVKISKNVRGKNNSFISGEGCLIDKLGLCIIGDNNKITIGRNCTIQKGCNFWIIGNNSSIVIGDDTRIGANCAIEVQEDNQHITVGNDNLWSHNIRLRNNDSHYIYDKETGKRTNLPRGIEIGNHVWIAAFATILKGVHVGNGSVIGTHALVTKDVPENVVSVGIPAKMVQSNIEWSDSPKQTNINGE